jgi:hypothetical protein
MATFGTPVDLTLTEMTVELFLAADPLTQAVFAAR